MRILTVVGNLGLGGTQRTAVRYAVMAKQLGHDCSVFTYQPGLERGPELDAAGIDLFAHPAGFDSALSWRPDIVHFHRAGDHQTHYSQMIRASKEAGAKVVETNIFSRPDYSPEGRMIDLHCQLTKWCWLRYQKRSWFLRDDGPSVEMPNPADDFWASSQDNASRQRGRKLIGLPEDAFVYGRIAQPIASKWMESVLGAFGRVAEVHPNAWLGLIGPTPEFMVAADRLPPGIRARIAAYSPIQGDQALADAYGAFDCFLHSAYGGESFGNVLVESLMCGIPVITEATLPRDNSQGLVVGHRRGGLVCVGESGLTEAMEAVIREPSLLAQFGRMGKEYCLDHYSSSAVLPKLERLYSAVAASQSHADLAARLRESGDLLEHRHVHEAWQSRHDVMGSYPAKDWAEIRIRNSGLIYWLLYLKHRIAR